MAIDVKKLIAAINPDIFCEKWDGEKNLRAEVKKIAKEKGYAEAAKKAKLVSSDYVDIPHVQYTKSAFDKVGLKNPVESHELMYDAFSQQLEPIYFWILDYVNTNFGGAEKLVDNFIASPGSGHFAEFQGRVTRMQDEASKIMGQANTVIRSILNLIYDLKEFKLLLKQYDAYNNAKDSREKHAALLSLKQRWMDNVDIKRGNGSINVLAQQLDFVTIRDAFFAADTLDDVAKLDLNMRVKRILEQRVKEFERWIGESEKELRKRFEIEKIYLRSQANSAKLYARWAKPYMKAARDLEQTAQSNANLVNAFNTVLFELTLMAKGKYDPSGDIASGELPKVFKKLNLRKYTPITIVEFLFRSIPDRSDQKGGYTYRGRAEVTFTSFALSDDELSLLKQEIEKDDLGDAYAWITGATDDSFAQISGDIDELLGDTMDEKQKEVKKEDTNPFSALFSGLWNSKSKSDEKDLSKGMKPDNANEQVLRSQALLSSRMACRKLYLDYKKAHNMPALPPVMN